MNKQWLHGRYWLSLVEVLLCLHDLPKLPELLPVFAA